MCAMKFRKELSYDAPPADVFAMLADPAFRERVCAAQDVVSADVTLTPSGSGFTLVMDQVQKTAGLPAVAKKFAGDTTQAVVKESWSDQVRGSVEIITPGKPTNAAGTVTLSATAAGTTETVELDVKVKVPLIGGKLEQLMVDNIEHGYAVEHSVGVEWLAAKS